LLESTLERRCCLLAKKAGWLAIKWAAPGQWGVPDRLLIRAGRVIAVEFKAPGKVPTKLQEHRHAQLQAAGLDVFVIDNVDDFQRITEA